MSLLQLLPILKLAHVMVERIEINNEGDFIIVIQNVKEEEVYYTLYDDFIRC